MVRTSTALTPPCPACGLWTGTWGFRESDDRSAWFLMMYRCDRCGLELHALPH